jgi:hypothetical protein
MDIPSRGINQGKQTEVMSEFYMKNVLTDGHSIQGKQTGVVSEFNIKDVLTERHSIQGH